MSMQWIYTKLTLSLGVRNNWKWHAWMKCIPKKTRYHCVYKLCTYSLHYFLKENRYHKQSSLAIMKPFQSLFVATFCLLFLSLIVSPQLDYKYYDQTCPNLTKIVRYNVRLAILNDTRMAASLLRLHFHDCFVNVGKTFSFLIFN